MLPISNLALIRPLKAHSPAVLDLVAAQQNGDLAASLALDAQQWQIERTVC